MDEAAAATRVATGGKRRAERALSVAILLLVVALIGAALWVGFSAVINGMDGAVSSQVNSLGG